MIQGIWMWPNNVYEYGAEKIIAPLGKAGFTDIYFLTKGLSGKTSFIGKTAPAAFDRDVLKEVINCAHQYGIHVHAWFTSASDEHFKSIHPESGRAHFSRGKDRGLISFKNEAYREYLLDVLTEVTQNYSVDGIHLDYIRYNHMLYGWDEQDILAYEAFGADKNELFSFIENTFYSDVKDDSIFEAYKRGNKTLSAFVNSRRNDVNQFAKYLLDGIRERRPELIYSAAVMPEGAYRDHSFADLHYGQILNDLSPHFDYLIPMAYSKAYDKTSEWVYEIRQNLTENSIPFAVGIQAYDHQDGASIQKDILSAKGADKDTVLFREGECALVYFDGGWKLFNDTDYTITKIELRSEKDTSSTVVSISPGETARLDFPALPDQILLYSEDKDICVYFDKRLIEKGISS